MKHTYTKVESFDIDQLRRAFDEGRLFIIPIQESVENARNMGLSNILNYVGRIDHCASPHFRHCVKQLWQQIVSHEQLTPLFFFHRYQKNRGHVNWYRVTAVVCLLREWQVYSTDYSSTDLHCILEGTNRRNSRYTGMARYLLDKPQMDIIKQMVKEKRQ